MFSKNNNNESNTFVSLESLRDDEHSSYLAIPTPSISLVSDEESKASLIDDEIGNAGTFENESLDGPNFRIKNDPVFEVVEKPTELFERDVICYLGEVAAFFEKDQEEFVRCSVVIEGGDEEWSFDIPLNSFSESEVKEIKVGDLLVIKTFYSICGSWNGPQNNSSKVFLRKFNAPLHSPKKQEDPIEGLLDFFK